MQKRSSSSCNCSAADRPGNFFARQRVKLDIPRTHLARRMNKTASAVLHWERDYVVPLVPVDVLAAAYEVSETRMSEELIALRRRIEANPNARRNGGRLSENER